MTSRRQCWLVAQREVRERSRSTGFRVGMAITVLVVVAAIVAPAVIRSDPTSYDIGLTGTAPRQLADALTAHGDAVDVVARVHAYDHIADGQAAVRDEVVDVLVVGTQRLEWRGRPDGQLHAIAAGAIQAVVAQQRAAAAGIDPDQLLELVAPVPLADVELGVAAGRGPDDETAALLMAALLLAAISVYGNLVLTGVVEEKSNRVVEVLLARMPARALLAGKVAGIGLLGFAQLVVTAVAALAASVVVDTVDLPAVSGSVLAWVVTWFVLGYILYAMAYGALGSLASRTEDAQSVAGPIVYGLLVGFWASVLAVGEDPDGGWSQVVSFFPATAPFAMPPRIALGAAAWWEVVLAPVVTVAAIVALVMLAGRVYRGGVLHGGSTLKLRDAWRRATTTDASWRGLDRS